METLEQKIENLKAHHQTNTDKYLVYLDEHIGNVKLVWERLQPLLENEYWLDDYNYFSINEIIKHHDESKYNGDEFFPYLWNFYPAPEGTEVNKQGYMFNKAWNLHQKSNKHHWQYWVMIEDSGEQIVLDMPFFFIIELLCDWTAMSIKFKNKPSEWYGKNKDKMILHEKTISCIEHWMPLFDSVYSQKLNESEA